MPRQLDADEVCTLLESGTNIVTTRGEFHRPASIDPEPRQRVEAACEAGNTSIHSTGSSPGFITEALPLVLLSLQRRFECLTIDEFADLSGRNSPDLLFNIMGFGKEPTEFHPARLEHGKTSFGPSLLLVADHLGIEIAELDASGEFAVATKNVEITAGTVPKGTVAGQRLTVAANRPDGTTALRFRATWYCGTDLDQDWDLLTTGWAVRVEGDAPMDIRIEFPGPLDQMAGYTANRAVNAVPAVVAAEPGIRTTFELPQVVAHLT
jgi:4-hydroxy-tetrahydrodipicolinate reductase